MMGTNYVESSLKRFLKRKVKITLGLVVVFMITGSVGYAKDIAIGGLWDEWSVNEEVKQEITIENNMLTTENNNLSITTGKVGIGYNGTVNVIDGNLAINAGSNGILSGYGKESQVNILANDITIDSDDNGILVTWGDWGDLFKGHKGYVKIGEEGQDGRKITNLTIDAGGQGIDNKQGKTEIYGTDTSIISITSNGTSGVLEDQSGIYNSSSKTNGGIISVEGGTINVSAKKGSGVKNDNSSGTISLSAEEKISISSLEEVKLEEDDEDVELSGIYNEGTTEISGKTGIEVNVESKVDDSYGIYNSGEGSNFKVESTEGTYHSMVTAEKDAYGIYTNNSLGDNSIKAGNDIILTVYSKQGNASGIEMSGQNASLKVEAGNNINITAVSNADEGNAYGINVNGGSKHNQITLEAKNGEINLYAFGTENVAGIEISSNTNVNLTAKNNINISAFNKSDSPGYGIHINNTSDYPKENAKVSLLSTAGDIIINTGNYGTENNSENSTSYGISNKYGVADLTAKNIFINTFASNSNPTESSGVYANDGIIDLKADDYIGISSKSNTGSTKALFATGNDKSNINITASNIGILADSEKEAHGIYVSNPNNKITLKSNENIIVSSKSNIETASTGYTTGLYNNGVLSLKGDGVISISSVTDGENSYSAFNFGGNLDLTGKTRDESTAIFISSQSKKGQSYGIWGDTGAKNTLKGENIVITSLSENGTSDAVLGIGAENTLTGTNISIISGGGTTSTGLYGENGANNTLNGKIIQINSISDGGKSYGIQGKNAKNTLTGEKITITSSGNGMSRGLSGESGANNTLSSEGKISINSISTNKNSVGIFSSYATASVISKNDEINVFSSGVIDSKAVYGMFAENIFDGKNISLTSLSEKGQSIGINALYNKTNNFLAKEDITINSTNINGMVSGVLGLASNINMSSNNTTIVTNSTNGKAYGIYGQQANNINMSSNNTTIVTNSTNGKAYGILTENRTLDAANNSNLSITGNTVVSVSGKKIESGDLQNNSHAAEVLAEGNNTISKLFLDGKNTGAVTQGIRAYNSTMNFTGSLTSVSTDIAMTSIGENSNITVNEGTHRFEGNSYLIDAAGDYSGSLIVRPVIQSLDGGNITLNGDTTVISRTAEDDTEDHISNAGIYVQGHTDADKDTTSSININGNLTVVSGNDNFDENNGDFSYEDIYTEKVKDIIKSTDIALMATSKAEINVNSKDKNVFLIGDIVAGKDGSKISIEGGKLDNSSGLPSMVVVGEVLGANGGTVNLDMSNGGYFAGRVDDYNKIDEFKDTDFRDNKFESDIEKGGTVTLKMDNGAVWNVIGQSYVTNLEFGAKGGGTVDLTYEGNALRIKELAGQGTFNLVLYGDSDTQHEKSEGNMLYIYNAENAGEQTVNLAESALYIDYGEKVRFATLGKDAYGKVSFKVEDVKEEGINDVSYSTEYEEYNANDTENIVYNGDEANNNKPGNDLVNNKDNETDGFDAAENWYLTRAKEKINDNGQTVIEMAKANYASAVYMDNLNKRLGDMSFVEGNEGLWVRMRNDRVGEDSEYRLRNYMTQIGYDKTYDLDDGKEYRGAALDYTQGEMEYKNIHGESNIDRYTFTAYDTRVYNSGSYADYVARAGYMESDFEIYGRQTGNKAEGDFDNLYFGLSAEFGKRYNFGEEERSYFEPQVQLQYTYIDDTDYTTNQNTKVDYDNIHSLIGRAGFRLGHDFYEEDSKDNTIYLKADINHEFLGDQDVSAMDLTGKLDETYHNDGTWYDVGIGGAKNLSENLYVYADVERQFGTGKDNSWQFNLGFRYKFGTLEDFTLTNLFDFDKSEIKPEGKQMINDAAVKLNKKNVKGTVVIEGHTDWYGSEEYNQVLSEKRAKAVEEQFKNTVTNEKVQIESKGYGETKPVADNNTPEGRAQNRRVEVKYSR